MTTKTVLFLGYDRTQTPLIDRLEATGATVTHTSEPITRLDAHDLTISFGYRHILRAEVLATAPRPPLNLHISFLPYNRGAHPNFWAFYDGTPSGVTIHAIDPGLDTGPIAFQRKVAFTTETTFAATHTRLIAEIEALFTDNLNAILTGDFDLTPQQGKGTSHKARDLPEDFKGWQAEIAPEIARLKARTS